MGFQKSWSVENIALQINNISRECNSPYNDGMTAWYLKQDLYLIKEVLDQAFNSAPHFGSTEDQWLTEQEKKRIVKILKS